MAEYQQLLEAMQKMHNDTNAANAKLFKEQADQMQGLTHLVSGMGDHLKSVSEDMGLMKNQLLETMGQVAELAKSRKDQEVLTQRLNERLLELEEAMKELKHNVDQRPKVYRMGSPRTDVSGPSSSTSAPASSTGVSAKPTVLEVSGVERGFYAAFFQTHFDEHIKVRLTGDLKEDAKPVFPHMRHFYKIRFSSFELALAALKKLKDLDKWVDPRHNKEKTIQVKFERTFDEKMAGKFRSFFYQELQTQLKDMESFKGRSYSIGIPNQTLTLDVNGDPFELVHLPKINGKFQCRVTPYYANFIALGITQDTAQGIIDRASAKAQALE